MKETILQNLTAECPWRDTLLWYEAIDSTNTQAKILAKAGALQGTVLIADRQTAGRGRMGRSFHSPENAGIYMSVILRPNSPPAQLMHLTCAAGVAMGKALEQVTGLQVQLKWINDLVYGTKKLGGILTELSLDSRTGLCDYAVVGIGINCNQETADIPGELRHIAASLRMVTGQPVDRAALAAAMIEQLYRMNKQLLTGKAAIMDAYRQRCVTLGKEVSILRGEEIFRGFARDMDDDGGLVIDFSDGHTETVSSGEVSVRGLYNYL